MVQSFCCRGWFSPAPFSEAIARPTEAVSAVRSDGLDRRPAAADRWEQVRSGALSKMDVETLRSRAALIRRLAAHLADEPMDHGMLDLAAAYEDQAAQIEAARQ